MSDFTRRGDPNLRRSHTVPKGYAEGLTVQLCTRRYVRGKGAMNVEDELLARACGQDWGDHLTDPRHIHLRVAREGHTFDP